MGFAILLFIAAVVAGFVFFGYIINKKKSKNKDDAMSSGKEIREGGTGDN